MPPFINPYNFVRQGPNPREEHYREYARLDHYEGRSGRIEFTLQNLSPLFIADPEGTTYHLKPEQENAPNETNEPKYHKVADFFNVNDVLAIPGTSIKGMIRSVAEAISNSSFGVFTPDQKQLTFRKIPNLNNRRDLIGRKWGKWAANNTIIPMESAKIWREEFDNALGIPPAAAGDAQRDAIYTDLRKNPITISATLWQLHTGPRHVQHISGSYNGVMFTRPIFSPAMSPLGNGTLRPRANGFKSEIVDSVSGTVFKGPAMQVLRRALTLPPGASWAVQYQTVANIGNGAPPATTFEDRVSVVQLGGNRWTVNPTTATIVPWPRAGWADMEPAVRDNSHYVTALIVPPTATLGLTVSDDAIESFERAYVRKPILDEIVRYFEDGGGVAEFGPVGMYKTPENNTVKELAATTPHILPRKKNTALCPASRLFGWTPDKETFRKEEEMPVAGRIRMGVAWSDKTTADTRPTILKILGSPKPKYYPFYLRPADQDQDEYSGVGYYSTISIPGDWWPQKGALRGRKFYLHHPGAVSDPNNARQAPNQQMTPDEACEHVKMTPEMLNEGDGLQSHQNMTACVLPPGGTFTGYLEFDSLADYELGLLLWAVSLSDSPLQSDPGRAHKLGMGRPIGMGTVRLSINHVFAENPVDGWRAGDNQGTTEMDAAEAERLVRVFKTWMMTGREMDNPQSAREFDQQVYYRELCELVSLNLAGETTIQYHPGTNLKYFAAQRKERMNEREQTLKTPIAVRNGRRQFWEEP